MHRDFGLYHVRLIIGWLLGAMALHPITADAQNATAPAVVVAQAENTGQDFLRPLNMFQLRYEYETAPGSGSEKGTISTVTSDIVTLRADHRIDQVPNGRWVYARTYRSLRRTRSVPTTPPETTFTA